MAEEEVGLRLALKNRREVASGIDDVGDKLDRAGDEADRLNRRSRLAAGGLISMGKSGRIAGRAVVYGVGGAATAVVGAGIALTKFSKDAIGEAREAQKVGAVTRAEIKATGGAANITARQVGNLSGAISEKVGIDDEAIQSGANLLLTFKNVRNEAGRGNKVFNQATKAAVDLSAAGFGSIESGSKMLGKALNDPLKGITALSRAGVTFSDEQIERIQGFVEENKLLAAQKIILGEVESQVGGVAAAQATWGDKAGVLWGNIQERFGTAILPLLDRAQRWFVQEGGPQLDRWIGAFEDRGIPALERGVRFIERKALPAVGDFLDEARPLAESVIPAIGSGLEAAADAFEVIAPLAKNVFDGFNSLPDWAKTGIALSIGAGALAKKAGAFDRGSLLGTIATQAKPLPVWVVNKGGVPGLPGTPGGPATPKAPGTPPAVGWGSRFMNFLRGPVGRIGLGAGVTYFSQGGYNVGTKPGEVGDEEDFWKAVNDERKEGLDALNDLLVKPLGNAKLLNDEFAVLGAQKPRPNVQAPGLEDTLTGGDRLVGLLGRLDRTTARPRVDLDTSLAEARLVSLQAKVNAFDVATMTAGSGSTSSAGDDDHNWNDLRGPRDRKPRARPPRPPRLDPRAGRAAPSRAADGPIPPIHVHVNVDSREIGSAVIDDLDDQLARR